MDRRAYCRLVLAVVDPDGVPLGWFGAGARVAGGACGGCAESRCDCGSGWWNGGDTNVCDTAEMWSSADRVWQAVRLYKVAKADKIVVTGGGVVASTKVLLLDFGVSDEAIIFDEVPRNTE